MFSSRERVLNSHNGTMCAIWPDWPVNYFKDHLIQRVSDYVSPRAGGNYVIVRSAERQLRHTGNSAEADRFRARLTTWLVERRSQGEEWPTVKPDVVLEVQRSTPLPVSERALRLLRLFARLAPNLGGWTTLSKFQAISAMIWSESVDLNEVVELIEDLAKAGLIKSNVGPNSSDIRLCLTAKGLTLTEQHINPPSRRIGFDLPHRHG